MPYKDNEKKKSWYQENKARLIPKASAVSRALRLKDPEKYKAAIRKSNAKAKEREKTDPEYAKKMKAWRNKAAKTHRLRIHAVTQEQYDRMLIETGGCCSICGNQFKREYDEHIDHDHKTGITRGLLCSKCNVGLGMFQDSAYILQKAIDYLRKHGCL